MNTYVVALAVHTCVFFLFPAMVPTWAFLWIFCVCAERELLAYHRILHQICLFFDVRKGERHRKNQTY